MKFVTTATALLAFITSSAVSGEGIRGTTRDLQSCADKTTLTAKLTATGPPDVSARGSTAVGEATVKICDGKITMELVSDLSPTVSFAVIHQYVEGGTGDDATGVTAGPGFLKWDFINAAVSEQTILSSDSIFPPVSMRGTLEDRLAAFEACPGCFYVAVHTPNGSGGSPPEITGRLSA